MGMTCPSCGYETAEIPIPDEHDLEAAYFFFEAIIRAGAGHFMSKHDAHSQWHQISEDVRRAFGHAAAEFKKRYVCAG